MALQNLAVKLCGILQAGSKEEITAREWRLIGQELDGSQLLTWVSTSRTNTEQLHIGVYTNKTKSLYTLHVFDEKLNIIQASVNFSHSLLVYVVKVLPSEGSDVKEALYCPFLLPLECGKDNEPIKVEEGSPRQTMVQYVYGKSHKYSPGVRNDRFLLFKHLECIKIYSTTMFSKDCDDGTEEWSYDGVLPEPDTIVRVFSWAQWDCINQVLYYIHYRSPAQSFAEGEEVTSPSEATPTLSALQFHAALPHETVLNIPLSLPQLPSWSGGAACGQYEDDPVPLRVHDCSLDLQIVADPAGVLCICHHYLYKPLDESTSSLLLEESAELKESGVNFAYSVTLLHHGCVVHSVVPDLPWPLAKSLRPSYTLYADDHLLVNIPMLFTHLLDVSLTHEPCNHIVLPSEETDAGPSLAPIIGWGPNAMVDLNTLDVVALHVPEKDLVAAFKSASSVENKMAILHYLLLHDGRFDLAEELLSWLCVHQRAGPGPTGRAMQEYLVGAAHAHTRRALAAAAGALPLADLLPFTRHDHFAQVKVRDIVVSVSQEKLWNSAVVVLAPRQRVCQFAEDLWTRLWAALNRQAQLRFEPSKVLEKLRVSLHCYQPEALSRCSTPHSPQAPAPLGLGMGSGPPRRASLAASDPLPFHELDLCTASKQEHIVAANLREVSMHLLRGAGGAGGAGAAHAHGAASRWAAAQLEASRALCRAVCRAVGALPSGNQPRGFAFIDELDPSHALIVFKVLEQYYLAADSVAFPLPQGFASFFTYLAYRALPPQQFAQYVHRNVLELHIDVLKAIVTGKDDDQKSVDRKLRLIQLVGAGRARRTLAAWPHRAALLLRARDHAATLLSGEPAARRPGGRQRAARDPAGMAALPSGERLSPLDTFLDLLTAKASLNELDFNLIIEATLASMQADTAA